MVSMANHNGLQDCQYGHPSPTTTTVHRMVSIAILQLQQSTGWSVRLSNNHTIELDGQYGHLRTLMIY